MSRGPGGGRPATASVTRNGSDVGGNRSDTHYTHTRAHARTCAFPPSLLSLSLLFLLPSVSFSVVILLSLRPDHPPARGPSNHISLYVTLSDAASLLFSRASPYPPLLAHSSSLGYNVAASSRRARHRWLRLCTAEAGTYYAACAARYALRGPVRRRRRRRSLSSSSLSLSLSLSRASSRSAARGAHLIQFAQSGG